MTALESMCVDQRHRFNDVARADTYLRPRHPADRIWEIFLTLKNIFERRAFDHGGQRFVVLASPSPEDGTQLKIAVYRGDGEIATSRFYDAKVHRVYYLAVADAVENEGVLGELMRGAEDEFKANA